MKKILMIASISLMLVDLGFCGAAKYKLSPTKKDTPSYVRKSGGDKDRFLLALNIPLADLEQSFRLGSSNGWLGLGGGWIDKDTLGCEKANKDTDDATCKKGENGLPIERKLEGQELQNALEEKRMARINNVVDFYSKRFKDSNQAIEELHKDMHAFENFDYFKTLTNQNLKAKIKSLLDVGENAAMILYSIAVDARVVSILEHRLMINALEEAQMHKQFAIDTQDTDSRDLYNEVIKELKIIQATTEQLKNQYGLTNGIIKAKNFQAKYVGIDKVQEDMYARVQEQLKMQHEDIVKAQKEADDIIKASGNDAVKALKKAEKLLADEEKKSLNYQSDNNLLGHASGMNHIESKVRFYKNVLEIVKKHAGRFERTAETRVEELMREHGTATKALDYLLYGSNGRSLFDTSRITWDSVASQNAAINKITNDIDREAAKLLQKNIKNAVVDSNSSMNYMPGVGAQQNSTGNSALDNVLTQAGLNAVQLQSTVKGRALQADLINLLQDAAKKQENIAMSKLPDAQKAEVRRDMANDMAKTIADRIATYKGLSLGTASTLDPSLIASELFLNKATDYLLGQ